MKMKPEEKNQVINNLISDILMKAEQKYDFEPDEFKKLIGDTPLTEALLRVNRRAATVHVNIGTGYWDLGVNYKREQGFDILSDLLDFAALFCVNVYSKETLNADLIQTPITDFLSAFLKFSSNMELEREKGVTQEKILWAALPRWPKSLYDFSAILKSLAPILAYCLKPEDLLEF